MQFLNIAIALFTGLIVLLGYFIPALAPVQNILLQWAILLAAFAVLLGVFNLISVHGEKIRRNEKGSAYSAILLLAFFVTFFAGLFLRFWRPDQPWMQWIMNAILQPVESSLMAILTVTLIYAAIRLPRRHPTLNSLLFLAFALLSLTGLATLPWGEVPFIGLLARWTNQVLALGGARGILLGVALGTLTTGLRVLFGVDRPYGGK
jgi:hypothetical protein